jgi:hypothetical protein
MSAWWEYHDPSPPKPDSETREFVEYMTGCIPLFLRSLVRPQSDQEFDRQLLLASPLFCRIAKNLTSFYETRLFRNIARSKRDR